MLFWKPQSLLYFQIASFVPPTETLVLFLASSANVFEALLSGFPKTLDQLFCVGCLTIPKVFFNTRSILNRWHSEYTIRMRNYFPLLGDGFQNKVVPVSQSISPALVLGL